MATLALGIIGGSLFGVVGGIAGVLLGSMVDNKLFSTSSIGQTGQRLSDLRVTNSSYGQSIPIVYGAMRVPGTLIWAEDMKEHEVRTSQKVGSGKGKTTVVNTSYYYTCSFALAVSAGAVAGIGRIWFDNTVVYNVTKGASDQTLHASAKFAEQISIYLGDEAQGKDSRMAQKDGIEKTPAYRGLAYIVFRDIRLDDYGNRIPNINVEVIQSGHYEGVALVADQIGVADIIKDLTVRAGLSLNDVDVTEINQEVCGFAVYESSFKDAIAELMKVFLFTCKLTDKIVFLPWKRPHTSALIAAEELGFATPESTGGSDADGGLLQVTRKMETQLPKSVEVTYYDPRRAYQVNTQRATRQLVKSENIAKIEANVAIETATAAQAAENHLFHEWMSRSQYAFTAGIKYLALEVGDVVDIKIKAYTHSVQITKQEIGADYSVRFQDKAYTAAAFDSSAGGAGGSFDDTFDQIEMPGDTWTIFANLPPLREDLYGFYFGATGDNAAWKGAALFVSKDGGVSYTRLHDFAARAVIGEALNVLPSAPHTIWDRTSHLDVRLVDGSLESATEDAVLMYGENAILVGKEIIQFAQATLIGEREYRLTNLLRGRRGTEWAKGKHEEGEDFALLDSLDFIEIKREELNQTNAYKVVPYGMDSEDVNPEYFTCNGEIKRPFSPVHGWAERQMDGSVVIGWTRRGRIGTELPDGSDMELGETFERYLIDVYKLDGSIAKTYTLNRDFASQGNEPIRFVYPAADAAAHFGTLPSEGGVKFAVAQFSEAVGRGRELVILA